MYTSTIVSLVSILNFTSAQQSCPPGTPKTDIVRFAWQHRWLRCENMNEGECPKKLPPPYSKPARDNCEIYLTESGEDYKQDYYFCEKQSKFDELKPILDRNGWACVISE